MSPIEFFQLIPPIEFLLLISYKRAPYKRTGEKLDGRPILEQFWTGDKKWTGRARRQFLGKFHRKGEKKIFDRNLTRPFIRGGVEFCAHFC